MTQKEIEIKYGREIETQTKQEESGTRKSCAQCADTFFTAAIMPHIRTELQGELVSRVFPSWPMEARR